MRILLNFHCEQCREEAERLQRTDDPAPTCANGHGAMTRSFSTPAFTFKRGKGTSGGNSMRIAGHAPARLK
jgi:putative FmdB family regulatory protein